jgi:hypothetical protein
MSTESDPTTMANEAQTAKMPQNGGPPKKNFLDFMKGRSHGETGQEQSNPVNMSQRANMQREAEADVPKDESKKHFMDFVKGRYHGEIGPEQAKAEASSREQTPRASVDSKVKEAPMEYKPKKNSFRAFMKGELQE